MIHQFKFAYICTSEKLRNLFYNFTFYQLLLIINYENIVSTNQLPHW